MFFKPAKKLKQNPLSCYLIYMKTAFRKIVFIGISTAFLIAAPLTATAQTQPAPGQDTAIADTTPIQSELPPDVDPNGPLAQIITLAQSGVDESVLVSYASNAATPFNLTADQIIYLKDIGVPDSVVQAMIQRDQQLGVTDNTTPSTQAAPEMPPSTNDVSDNYFYGALAPYGGWVTVGGYGLCWRPSVVIYNSDWQPYCDHGRWVYTDDGWFWLSDYSWGWAAFHYGRWFHDSHWGWCWWPDTTWAPSWVCWRYSDDYCGWASLPPFTAFQTGIGLAFNGVAVTAGSDFGISPALFSFVPIRDFCDPHPARYRVAPADVPAVYNRTAAINGFGAESGVIVNRGIDPRRIAAVTHAAITPVTIREASSPVARGAALGPGQTLVINRPVFTGSAVATMHQGVAPQSVPQPSAPHPWYTTQPRQNGNQPLPAAGRQYPAWTAPQQIPQAPRVETPAEPQPVYRENQEPMPEYNDSPGERYTSPRSQPSGQEQQPSREEQQPARAQQSPSREQQQQTSSQQQPSGQQSPGRGNGR